MDRPSGCRGDAPHSIPARQGAQERLHIVEGLVKAVDMIDAIMKTIRAVEGPAAPPAPR